MKLSRRVVASLFALFLMAAVILPVMAQTPSASETVPITMTVTAEGKGDVTPPPVTKEDVQVYQSRKRMAVTSWTPVNGNVSLAIIIDDSLDPGVGLQIGEIASWVRDLPYSVSILVGYARNDSVQIAQNFTSEHPAAAKALRLPVGGPGAFSSIYLSLQDFLKRWKTSSQTREILVVTDGVDRFRGGYSFASPDLDTTIERAQRQNIVIHTLYARSFDRHGRHVFRISDGLNALSRLADETGGEAYFQGFDTPISFKPYLDDLRKIFQQQYSLVFQAQPRKKSGFQRVKLTTELPRVELSGASQVYVPVEKK